MKIKVIIYAIIICILSQSCTKHKIRSDADEFYDLSTYDEGSLYDVFDSIELVPLLFEQDTYPNVIFDYELSNTHIFVEDKYGKVHVFTSTGHYVSCSANKYGNGPGEYITMTEYLWNPFSKKLEVMTLLKMLSFDENFNHYRTINLPSRIGENSLVYDYGIALSETKYLLHDCNITSDPYHVILYDVTEEKTLKKWCYYDDVICGVHMDTRVFTRMPNGDMLLCPAAFVPYIYRINEKSDSLEKAIEFHYADDVIKTSPMKTYKDNPELYKEYSQSTTIAFPMRQLINSRMIFTLIKKGQGAPSAYYLVTDRRTGKTLRCNLYDNDHNIMPQIKLIDEDYGYLINTKEFILSNLDILMDKADQAEELLSEIDDEDFVLLKYRIKKPA